MYCVIFISFLALMQHLIQHQQLCTLKLFYDIIKPVSVMSSPSTPRFKDQ